ncbi:MAG: outer membrane lipoprotein-sorting protein, partial [Bacteroidia bacterium]|nr:outer membrane lipoprotein-sorting protein [Bacteroidia bacterium]
VTMEVPGDGDKSIIVFDTPKDVKGTASMTYSHKVGDDDQWLYLPAIARVKRISSSNKSGPFMGSEFAFEDLSSQEVEKYTYKYIGEEKANGVDCYKVERYPVATTSGYKRNIVWFNKSNYRPEVIEFYDRKDALLKTLTFSNYKSYLSKYWRAGTMKMVNHQNGKETLLEFGEYKFGIDLTEEDFSQNSLKRAN